MKKTLRLVVYEVLVKPGSSDNWQIYTPILADTVAYPLSWWQLVLLTGNEIM